MNSLNRNTTTKIHSGRGGCLPYSPRSGRRLKDRVSKPRLENEVSLGHLGTDLTVLTVCDLKGMELPWGWGGGGRQPHSELVLFLILQIKRNKNSSSNQTRQASWRELEVGSACLCYRDSCRELAPLWAGM